MGSPLLRHTHANTHTHTFSIVFTELYIWNGSKPYERPTYSELLVCRGGGIHRAVQPRSLRMIWNSGLGQSKHFYSAQRAAER